MPIKEKETYFMKKKVKSKTPDFKTIEEETLFWDTHSFADYWNELEDVEMIFDLDKTRDGTLVLRVQKDVKDKLNQVAKSKGLNISGLVRMWVLEKLHDNLTREAPLR